MNEGSTLAAALAVAVAFAVLSWLRHRRAIVSGSEPLGHATAAFRRSAMLHCLAGGTLYFWLLLFLLPESLLSIEAGHNAYGIPLAGLIAGGVLAIVVSTLGQYLLRQFSRRAA